MHCKLDKLTRKKMELVAEQNALAFIRNFLTVIQSDEVHDIALWYCEAKRSLNVMQKLLENSVLYGAEPNNDAKIKRYVHRELKKIM